MRRHRDPHLSPTANQDLARLVDACHRKGIRFFIDAVMAFAKEEPYNHIDAQDFCIDVPFWRPATPGPVEANLFNWLNVAVREAGYGNGTV